MCWHQWGVVHDRVQVCVKCGKARAVECPHVWDKVKAFQVVHCDHKMGEIWVLQCKKCGEIKQERVGL